MRKFRFIAIILGIAVGGYLLGRVTATSEAPVLETVHREFPLFPAPPKPDAPVDLEPPKADRDVIIESPEEGTRPDGVSFSVSGRAKAGAGDVAVRVVSLSGEELYAGTAAVTARAGEPFGRFVAQVTLVTAPSENVTVRASLGDGDPAERIVLYGNHDEVTVRAFFVNNVFDPDVSCDRVFPVDRSVPRNSSVYREALQALLLGPNADEVAQGYGTSLPAGVRLKSVGADSDGVVTADFDDRLQKGVAGSCRVGGIRAQIEATLKQFPEVRGVVITVNGESEEVLQP